MHEHIIRRRHPYCMDCRWYRPPERCGRLLFKEVCVHPDLRSLVGHLESPAELRADEERCGRPGFKWEPIPPKPLRLQTGWFAAITGALGWR